MNKKISIIIIILASLLIASISLKGNISQNTVLEINPSRNRINSLGSEMPFGLTLSPGFHIGLFATGVKNPRDLQFTPNGTLLVSSPATNSVYALPDQNHDGKADSSKRIISDENHPHGLAFYNNYLFIALVDKVVRYKWDENSLSAVRDKVLFTLPQNSDHNSRTIVFNEKGEMFVSVGSTCNVCREVDPLSATVIISDQDGNNPHRYASGLRNAAFLSINPKNDELWSTEMGRDNLGDYIPPDEINIIKNGSDYGWPYCFGNKVHDNQFDPRNLNNCERTSAPIYEFPAHSAPLGLTFIDSKQFPSDWQGDLLVALHGSWNRSMPIGYKIVHLKIDGENITNSSDFVEGFLPPGSEIGPVSALGRPVDLAFDKNGNLYISDDKAGNVYILSKK